MSGGTVFVTNLIASPDGNGDRQVVTINKLRFVATKVADVLAMVSEAVGADLDAEPQLVTEDLGIHLPLHVTLTDAGLPNRARLCLVAKQDVAQQPAAVAAAADAVDSPQPRLLETKTLPLSPPAAARPGTDSSEANNTITVRDAVKAYQRQAQEACGSSRVTALDVVVQHAKGRPVYRLTRQQGGLGNTSVGAIKHMVLRFAGDVPVEHQRLFIGNRMRRDDELLEGCLVDEERTGQVVACARLFRHTLTASVTFEQDSQEFQIHELSPESDTVYTVREALHSARGELRQSYKGFDAMTCVLRLGDGSSASPLTDETPLEELRSTEDGGVVAFSVQLAAKAGTPSKHTGRRATSPTTAASSPQARAPTTTVSVGRLDPSPRYNKAAPRDVSVVVVTEDTETISIGSPARTRPKPKKAVPPPPRRRPSSTIGGGDQSTPASRQPTPREAQPGERPLLSEEGAPTPSPPPPPPLPPPQSSDNGATPLHSGTPSQGAPQKEADAATPRGGGGDRTPTENGGPARPEAGSPAPHVEVIDEPTHEDDGAQADEPESEEPPLIRTVATTSTIVLSSRVIQADLVERQRARRVRDSLCNEHSRRREDLLEASRRRLDAVKEKTASAVGLARRPNSNSRINTAAAAGGAGTPPPPSRSAAKSSSNQQHQRGERRPSQAVSPAPAAASPAPSGAVADRSALMSISPPRDGADNASASQPHHVPPTTVDTRSLIARIKAANARGVILGDPTTSRSSSAAGWGDDAHQGTRNGSAMVHQHHDATNLSANLGGGGPVMLNLSA